MKRSIGFVDYYISEWHANNYPEWIKQASKAVGEEFEVRYAWAERDDSLFDGATTEEWCEKFGVERCATIAELCEKSDFICILAPSNPEKHLEYAREVLKCGKNTYIDKTFAPDYATASEIFRLADEYGTKIFTTSALRYSTELEAFKGVSRVCTSGSGSNFEEYIIHQAEMVVKLLCSAPIGVIVEKTGDNEYVCEASFEGGGSATISYSPTMPFAIGKDFPNVEIVSDYFAALMVDILRFFITSNPSFDREETLFVMKLREALIRAKNTRERIEL